MYLHEKHSLQVCNNRIAHWERVIGEQEKIADPSPKVLQDLKTNRSLLNYWINYKKRHHG